MYHDCQKSGYTHSFYGKVSWTWIYLANSFPAEVSIASLLHFTRVSQSRCPFLFSSSPNWQSSASINQGGNHCKNIAASSGSSKKLLPVFHSLREVPNTGVYCFSAPHHQSFCSSLGKESLHPSSHSRDLLGREESRRAAVSASVEMGFYHLTGTGLLRVTGFPWRFSGQKLVGLQTLSLKKLRDWLYLIIRDCLIFEPRDWLILCSVCQGKNMFGSGYKAKLCFFGSGLRFRERFFGSDFRAKMCVLHLL